MRELGKVAHDSEHPNSGRWGEAVNTWRQPLPFDRAIDSFGVVRSSILVVKRVLWHQGMVLTLPHQAIVRPHSTTCWP